MTKDGKKEDKTLLTQANPGIPLHAPQLWSIGF